LGLARLAVLAPDAEGGRELGERFARAAVEHGAAVVGREIYRVGEVDFGPALERLKALTPDGIFLPGTPRELMTAIPQLAYYEVGTRLFALEELGAKDVTAVALEYLDEVFFADSYYQAPALGGESFAARYRRRFGSEPDPIASRGYVAARLAARALESGVTQPEDLTATLAAAAIPRTALLAPPEGGDAVPVFRVSREGITPVSAGGF
jgi:branched-chain amino acid transport system substrate-binding protein